MCATHSCGKVQTCRGTYPNGLIVLEPADLTEVREA